MHPKFERDVFLVNQKHLALGKSKYYVYDESGAELFYVERPTRLRPKKADVTIFHDEQSMQPAIVLSQHHSMELLHRDYTAVDKETGETLGVLKRDTVRAWFRRTWVIEDPSGKQIGLCREDSVVRAWIRRVVDFIPFVAIVGFALFKTDFHIFRLDEAGNLVKVGSFDRKMSLGDKYILSLREDPDRTFDRRLAVGLGILLDTAEAR